jgi:1,4-dihydroxy-2-naphthoate octaprenyltransferase
MTFLQALVALLRLGRPLFLAGGFVFFGLGTAIACYQGYELRPALWLWGQLAVTAGQLMTHYSNDYFDLPADLANRTPTRWSGGSRVLVETPLAPRWALYLALALLAVALAATALAGRTAQIPALTVLLAGVTLSWFYSSPPVRLHSRGVGELTAALVVPILTTLAGYTLQTGRVAALPLLAAVPLACFQFAMLLAIEFPDAEGDAAAGKRTLVVRLGPAGAARLWRLVLALGVLALLLAALAGLPIRPAVAMSIFVLPAMAWFWWRLGQEAWAEQRWWGWLGFLSIALLMGAAMVELIAFLSLCLLRVPAS